eukprot:118176_1
MEQKVILPDHDYVVAEKHKLIPSVSGYREINGSFSLQKKSKVLKYCGPTYVAVRSGKHDTTDAFSHGIDMLRTFGLDSFKKVLYYKGVIKSCIFWESDGANDESVKNDKMKKVWTYIFKHYDIDYICHYNSPCGMSAFNFIERYMVHLSRSIVGTVIDHMAHGNHLDASKKTIDDELEKKNFYHAQSALSEIFASVTVEENDFHSEAIHPMSYDDRERLFGGPMTKADRIWLHKHTHQGTLVFQMFKCDDRACCKPLRSNIRQFLPTGRLPTPTLFERRESDGLIVPVKPDRKPTRAMEFGDYLTNRFLSTAASMSVDTYRPDISNEKRLEMVCDICCSSFPNKTQKLRHRRAVHPRVRHSAVDQDQLEVDDVKELDDVVDDGALGIIGHRNDLFLVKYEDNVSWMKLPHLHPMVVEYKETHEMNYTDALPLISKENMKEWMSNSIGELVVEEDLRGML